MGNEWNGKIGIEEERVYLLGKDFLFLNVIG
jgi:hypothetical protein